MPAAATSEDGDGGRRKIAATLAHAERQLLALLAENRAEPRLTRLVDPVLELEDVLGPVIEAVRAAARQAGISSSRELRARRAAVATLSVLWCDLVELEPDHLARAWGARDLPATWAGHLAELMAAVEAARDRLEAAAEPGR